ncbi:uncharacterized protein EI90DRAFT_3095038 [Cantharellus anzutake]|uniref:uncharacterized protein n=1 Tax=Cantharellus anzutake TaxID=1750568 RepID=UPI001906434A|nr:uncharacterized protein EI90DRAFT_3095038 [Cantharellus anzutake]KAF8311938.1 hypothetical protein EI90DRAFT_3095038 [Cantharellus anzutake]
MPPIMLRSKIFMKRLSSLLARDLILWYSLLLRVTFVKLSVWIPSSKVTFLLALSPARRGIGCTSTSARSEKTNRRLATLRTSALRTSSLNRLSPAWLRRFFALAWPVLFDDTVSLLSLSTTRFRSKIKNLFVTRKSMRTASSSILIGMRL